MAVAPLNPTTHKGLTMPETHVVPDAVADSSAVDEIDPVKPVFEGSCLSTSGRSTLTFVIGKHEVTNAWHLRIAGNSGGGMFCDEWASAAAIDEVVKDATALTSRSFDVLHPGRSINTAGFVLAVLKHLGLIRVSADNTRHHRHVVAESFESVAMAAMDTNSAAKKTKAPKGKSKDAA
jgi:hypothetical protein